MSHLQSHYLTNKKHYAKCVDLVRETVGSYEKISQRVFKETGEQVSAGTIRNWCLEQRLPVEYAALFCDFSEGELSLVDFFPWVSSYV